MDCSRKSSSFKGFIRWLAKSPRAPAPELSASVLEAARAAQRDSPAVGQAHQTELVRRIGAGEYNDEPELLASAEHDPKPWLPRLRTANGFVLSALHSGDSSIASPVAVLVECPESMLEAIRGLKIRILCGPMARTRRGLRRWQGYSGLASGVEFKPPLGLRVDEGEERSAQVADPDVQR
jgi:hypothetical protein